MRRTVAIIRRPGVMQKKHKISRGGLVLSMWFPVLGATKPPLEISLVFVYVSNPVGFRISSRMRLVSGMQHMCNLAFFGALAGR